MLLIQNQTLAATGGEGDDRMNDVSNNPVTGRIYEGFTNGFLPKWRPSGDASYESFIADSNSGIIVATSTNTIPEELRKPPPPNFFKSTFKTTRVVLNPGNIKRISCVSKVSMPMNSFFMRYPNLFHSTGDRHVYFGKSQLIGLEKVLDSRNSESSISLAWEVNQTLKVKGRYVRNCSASPLVEVT